MFANLRRYRLAPESVDEMRRRVEEDFVPRVSEVPGFRAHYIVDVGSGEVLAISVFEDESGATRSQEMALAWVRENLSELAPSAPEITAGEILVHVQKLG